MAGFKKFFCDMNATYDPKFQARLVGHYSVRNFGFSEGCHMSSATSDVNSQALPETYYIIYLEG